MAQKYIQKLAKQLSKKPVKNGPSKGSKIDQETVKKQLKNGKVG